MPTFEVEFEVFCSCGAGLCNQSETRSGNKLSVTVEPCEKCLEDSREGGYEDGYKEAERDMDGG